MKRVLILIILCLPVVFAQNLYLNCEDVNTFSAQTAVTCSVEGPVDEIIEICVRDTCKNVNLEAESQTAVIEVGDIPDGVHIFIATAKYQDKVFTSQFSVTRSVEELFKITNLNYPESIKYDDEFDISFTVESTRAAETNDILVKLKNHDRIIDTPESIGRTQYTVNLEGKLLHTPLVIEVAYYDTEDNIHQITSEVPVKLTDLGIFERITLFYRGLMVKLFG